MQISLWCVDFHIVGRIPRDLLFQRIQDLDIPYGALTLGDGDGGTCLAKYIKKK